MAFQVGYLKGSIDERNKSVCVNPNQLMSIEEVNSIWAELYSFNQSTLKELQKSCTRETKYWRDAYYYLYRQNEI